jgi:dienelactone hydrolase
MLMAAGRSLGQDPSDTKPSELEKSAQAFVKLLEKGEFKKATKDFDATMKEKMPPDKLEEVWKGLIQQVGPFKKQGGTRTQKVQGYDIVFVTCEFEKQTLVTRVVFNKDKQIAGLFFQAKKEAAADYRAPAYVKRDLFHEQDLVVNAGDWPLPATLTVPNGDGPWPVAILVHGSGPQDRDETIGPNKPFRDLAWGLASRGVAVLRYEKRTKAHPARMAKEAEKLTTKEEVIDDVLAAVELVRKTPAIDPKRVYIIGHSLGGMCIPRIGTLDSNLAGLVALGGSTRPLEDVVVEQLDYILSLGDLSEQEKKETKDIRDKAADIRNRIKEGAALPAKLPLGFTAAYITHLHSYNPTEVAKQLKQPMLILQGGRDYQVTMQDFEGWRQALVSHKNVTFKLYPNLNHLFAEGTGKAKPSEYEREGHVSAEVITDIADWIKRS